MDAVPRTWPEGNLLALVHRLSSSIGRVFGRRLRARHGVSVPEWRTVMLLAERPDCTAIDISTYYAMDKMAVTRAVQRLNRMGMVERQRRPNDKRSFSLRLTAQGQELYETLLPTSTARYREFVDALSRDERRQLRELLSRLIVRAQELDN
jgi:DNA-binding MarR family transcriptional regulator